MALKLKPLSEQVVVITGASSGVGLVTARMAARQGATVAALARNAEALDALAEEICAQGGQALAVVCDVGQQDGVERAVETVVRELGGFDTWVNCWQVRCTRPGAASSALARG
ncbi:MAG: hypothetical protein OHK0022_37810 [Roseiflexaceae bacterium]